MNALIIIAIVVIILVVAAAVWMLVRKQRTEHLREHFGPEYDRAVRERGDHGAAEAALAARERRVEDMNLRPLAPDDRERFSASWRQIQAQFVDDPSGAVGEADRLIREAMQARGYPAGDFDTRAADLSVTYPRVVENYRAARAIAQRNERGEATTEDLRQAMVYDRALFEELLKTNEPDHKEASNERVA